MLSTIKNFITGGGRADQTKASADTEGVWGDEISDADTEDIAAKAKRPAKSTEPESAPSATASAPPSDLTTASDVVSPPVATRHNDLPADVGDDALPANYMDAHKILARLRDRLERLLAANGNRNLIAELRQKVKRLEGHIFKIQQGLQQLPDKSADQLANEQATERGRPSRNEQRSDRIRSALLEYAAGNKCELVELPALKEVTEPLALTPVTRLLQDETIRKLVQNFTASFLKYALDYLGSEDLLRPQDTRQRLVLEMASCRNPDRIRDLQSKIAALNSNTEAAQRNAIVSYLHATYRPAAEAQIGLLIACEHLLREYLKEATEAEAAWFAKFGVARQRTEISARIERFSTTVEAKRHGFENPQSAVSGTLPNIRHTLLDELFGITLP